MSRRILFLTATRADFGKLKPLMRVIDGKAGYECRIFVTGMHCLSRYGSTHQEVRKAGFRQIYQYTNQFHGEPMELVLANTIGGLSRYLAEDPPDMIVVHGDRIEALAGAIVGALKNVLVAHVEGGEMSGTIDGLIRHSISKLAHLHFVANHEAALRLKQLGEKPETLFVIGSPDIDLMLGSSLPSLAQVKAHYEIDFDRYAIAIFHSVTSELEQLQDHVNAWVDAMIESDQNLVVIHPNNDPGCEQILVAYRRLCGERFRRFPSLRFEYFLTLLKHADFILGNSSAGIREAPVFGVPTINVGSRQDQRSEDPQLIHVPADKERILAAIRHVGQRGRPKPRQEFGDGDSAEKFWSVLNSERIWRIPKQKDFYDLFVTHSKKIAEL